MAYLKFIPVDEVELGEIPEDMKPRWKKIVQMREQIDGLESAYEKTVRAFFREVREKIELEPDHSRDEAELSIDENGNVVQSFCKCPICQAKIQEVPLAQVLEALEAEKAISPEMAAKARKIAAEEQVETENAKLLRRMIN
jgi:hypothetical protein